MSWQDFKSRIRTICPNERNKQGFAAEILEAHKANGHWQRVFEHMKANGMEIDD
jgi:hypothetical protein